MKRIDRKAQLDATELDLRSRLLSGLAGDQESYLIFLKEMSAHLRAFFRKRLTQSPDDVEDLVQETLLAVHNQRHTYDEQQPLTAWVHAIARYKFIDLLRARTNREAMNDPLDDESEVFAASDIEAMDAHIDVESLLAQLPDRHRLPIVHVKLNGLSVQEAARETGMSESAIKVGIHRGLKALALMIRGRS